MLTMALFLLYEDGLESATSTMSCMLVGGQEAPHCLRRDRGIRRQQRDPHGIGPGHSPPIGFATDRVKDDSLPLCFGIPVWNHWKV